MRRIAAVPLLLLAVVGLTAFACTSSGGDPATGLTGQGPQYCPLHDPGGYRLSV